MTAARITNELEAEETWEEFNKKYKYIFAQLIEREELERVSQFPIIREEHEYKPKKDYSYLDQDKAASIIQNKWRSLVRSKKVKVPVRAGKKHSNEFFYFLNKQKIKKSLHLEGLAILEKALHEGNWDHPIFRKKNLLYLALTLYQSDRISSQQMYTILERDQTHRNFHLKNNFFILEENGQFTKEAVEFLLPKLQFFSLEKQAEKEAELESFRLLVSKLPRSEQVFYITDLTERYADPKKKSLGRDLYFLDAIYLDRKSNEILHLSFGAKDALGIAIYGVDGYVRAVPRLGEQTIENVEEAVRFYIRPMAIRYPGTVPYKNIHDYEEVIDAEASGHDYAHAKTMSSLPKNSIAALHLCIAVTQNTFNYVRSKEIWVWTDCDFTALHPMRTTDMTQKIKLAETDAKHHTPLFCKILSKGTATIPKHSKGGYLIINFDKDPTLTPAGINIFLDMVKHKDKWAQVKIDPQYLTKPYDQFYQTIEKTYAEYRLQHYKDSLNVFIFECLFMLKKTGREELFEPLLKIIDENKKYFMEHVKFPRVKRSDTNEETKEDANMIDMTLNGKRLSYEWLMETLDSEFKVSLGKEKKFL